LVLGKQKTNKPRLLRSGTIDFDSDAIRLKVFLARPDAAGSYPLLLVNHGGGGMDYTYEDLCLQLAGLGYVAAAMTFRGYYPSAGNQEYGQGEIKDILNLVDYLCKEKHVRSDHIGMFGVSRGGHYALLAGEQSRVFRALAIWSAPVDMFQHYQIHPELLEDTIGGSPADLPDAYRSRSSINFVSQLCCPVMIIHGEKDDVVPLWHPSRLATELRQLGKEYVLKILPDEGHNFSLTGFLLAWRETIRFFAKYLQPEG
jgi:dipeptidyl aminopeptidase/acylaminoacyl peptidase